MGVSTATSEPIPIPQTPDTGLRVLIVDDDPVALSTLVREIGLADIDVVGSTNDGEHALELGRVLQPDLALIDWDLRDFGGALLARLVQRYVPEVTPVLLVEAPQPLGAVQSRNEHVRRVRKDSSPTEFKAALFSIKRSAIGDVGLNGDARRDVC